MTNEDFGTWLTCISSGNISDIPQGWKLTLIQAGYCDSQLRLCLDIIPEHLLSHCHANIDRPVDTYGKIVDSLFEGDD